MKVHSNPERRSRRRYAANAELYLAGWGARRFRSTNHSAEGLFLELDADVLGGLSGGMTLELVLVAGSGRLVRLHRRRALVTHLNPRGVGLRLFHD